MFVDFSLQYVCCVNWNIIVKKAFKIEYLFVYYLRYLFQLDPLNKAILFF